MTVQENDAFDFTFVIGSHIGLFVFVRFSWHIYDMHLEWPLVITSHFFNADLLNIYWNYKKAQIIKNCQRQCFLKFLLAIHKTEWFYEGVEQKDLF